MSGGIGGLKPALSSPPAKLGPAAPPSPETAAAALEAAAKACPDLKLATALRYLARQLRRWALTAGSVGESPLPRDLTDALAATAALAQFVGDENREQLQRALTRVHRTLNLPSKPAPGPFNPALPNPPPLNPAPRPATPFTFQVGERPAQLFMLHRQDDQPNAMAKPLESEGPALHLLIPTDRLGTLAVTLGWHRQKLTVDVTAPKAGAAKSLQEAIPALDQALQTRGLRKARINVRLGDTGATSALTPRSLPPSIGLDLKL